MSRFTTLVPIALALLVACGEEPTGVEAPLLVGRWGVTGTHPAQLSGTKKAAELRIPCNLLRVARPVELAPNGSFAFEGRLRTSFTQVEPPLARVEGRLEGDVVRLGMEVLGEGRPKQIYTLRQGIEPGLDQLPPTCPQ